MVYFPLLQVEERTLNSPNLENPKIKSLIAAIRDLLENYIQKPQEVLDQISRFLFLLTRTTENIIDLLQKRTNDMQNEGGAENESESSFEDSERDENRTLMTKDYDVVSSLGAAEVVADEVLEQELKDLRDFYWEIQETVCRLRWPRLGNSRVPRFSALLFLCSRELRLLDRIAGLQRVQEQDAKSPHGTGQLPGTLQEKRGSASHGTPQQPDM